MSDFYRTFSRIFTLSILLTINTPVWGGNLFLELLGQARPGQQTLEEARRQIEEHKEIEIRDELSVSPFHQRGIAAKTRRQPLCLTCHLPLPHRENVRSRSFLNMHGRYIACETCHLQPENHRLEYRWLAYDDEKTEQIKPLEPAEPLASIVPFPGARIAPFYQGEAALVFRHEAGAQEIAARWENGSQEDKSQLKAALHMPLEKAGRECKQCHYDEDEAGPLDLRSLGASDVQRAAISQNIIARFFRRYKKEDERIRMTGLLEGRKSDE